MSRIRPAGPDDMPAIRRLAATHHTLDAWPDRPDYLDHELATGRVMVGETASGDLAGFGAAFERDGVRHLGDLFVDPERLGRGFGSKLLAELMPSEGDRTVFSSADLRAIALYTRLGLVPVAPLIHLEADRVSMAGFAPIPGERGTGAVAAEMDARIRGYDKSADHRFLASLDGVEVLSFPDGFAYLRRIGDTCHVGPAGDVSGSVDSLLAAVLAASRSPRVTIAVPGPHPALRPLLEAGFRIDAVDTIMTSPADLVDWTRVVPDPDLG